MPPTREGVGGGIESGSTLSFCFFTLYFALWMVNFWLHYVASYGCLGGHMKKSVIPVLCAAMSLILSGAHAADKPEDRQVLFGETHLHTVLSFDAYIFGNRNTPDDAYRFAKGEAIQHPAGFEMKLIF